MQLLINNLVTENVVQDILLNKKQKQVTSKTMETKISGCSGLRLEEGISRWSIEDF